MVLQYFVDLSELLVIHSSKVQVVKVLTIGRCFQQSRLPHIDEVFRAVHQVLNCRAKPFRLFLLTRWWVCSFRLRWPFGLENRVKIFVSYTFSRKWPHLIAVFIRVVTFLSNYILIIRLCILGHFNALAFFLTHGDSPAGFCNSWTLISQSDRCLSNIARLFNFRQVIILSWVELFSVFGL